MYVTLVPKLTYVKIGSSQHLSHGKAGLGAEIAARRPGFHIAVGEIEASRRRRTGERAVGIAAFDRSSFKRGQQGAADAAKARVRRDVVQRDLSGVGYQSDAPDAVAVGCDEERLARSRHPIAENLRPLVGQPLRQDLGIVAVICRAKLG